MLGHFVQRISHWTDTKNHCGLLIYIYTYVCVCIEQITNKDLLYSTVDGEGDDNLTSFISFCEN